MRDLTAMIRSAVVCRCNSAGKIQLQRVKGSSMSLPLVDEQKTRLNIERLMAELLNEMPEEIVLSAIKESVSVLKSNYTQTHDGFRVAKSAGRGRSVTIADLYSLVVAAGYCFDFLPVVKRDTEIRVGIGVMAPAIQDCGKNLIKLVWKAAGFDVVDLGNTVPPAIWLNEISQRSLSAVGISCMTNRCLDNVRGLLDSFSEHNANLPVIIGGIAVNKIIAFNLASEYRLSIYYGRDVTDAVEVLEKALTKTPVEVPVVKDVAKVPIPAELAPVIRRHGFSLFKIRISDIVIDEEARAGCTCCSGDKRRLCPLEIGYEKQKSLEESTEFICGFKFAVLVLTETPDESNRSKCKSIWESLLDVEQYFDLAFNSAHAFKFAMTCPFCLPKDCKLPKGECTFPSFYRPLHEQFNINMTKTLASVFGDEKPSGICSIILVR